MAAASNRIDVQTAGQPLPTPMATLTTPVGRGSIATVLLAGGGVTEIVGRLFHPASGRLVSAQPNSKSGLVQFGHWNHKSVECEEVQFGDAAAASDVIGENWVSPQSVDDSADWEEVVLTVSTPDPSTRRDTDYAGPTHIEIHCHGGHRAANSILASLQSLGCAVIPWTEWISRNQTRFECEIAESLAGATTQRTAQLLLAQGCTINQDKFDEKTNGLLRHEINQINQLIHNRIADQLTFARERIQGLIESGSIGLHLTEPWQVAVVGAPNVGKSSLVNALVGFQRAIVYDKPGTTRDELESFTAFDGWPMRLWDTAGLRDAADEVERLGISRVSSRIENADLVIHVRSAVPDPQQPPVVENKASDMSNVDDEWVLKIQTHTNVLVVRNKIDLMPASVSTRSHEVATSAITGAGLETLKQQIVAALIPRPPQIDTPLLFTRRQIELAVSALAVFDTNSFDESVALLAGIIDG